MRTRLLIVGLVAVLAVAGGVVLNLMGGGSSPTSRIKADPMPALFTTTQVHQVGVDVAAQRRAADRLYAQWHAQHGNTRDDKAFVAWLEGAFPAPTTPPEKEMPVVDGLFEQRTPAGVKAATWLEANGKKDIWKVYAHDEGEFLPQAQRTALKADMKATLKLSKTIADALGAKFASPAPYVVKPTLRPEKKVAADATCPCSYPSRHAAAGAAATALLDSVDPTRAGQYDAMQAQIDFSRIYMAGHFPADVDAGALLGDVIGDYVVHAWR